MTLLTSEGHRGHLRSPGSNISDEIAYAESNDVKLVAIGPVDAEL